MPELAHRRAYKLKHKKIPKGMDVLHKCDRKNCVNDLHFFLGTQRDNNKDRDTKGRGKLPVAVGADNGNAKLTESAVLKIRKQHVTGRTQKSLAKRFDVSINQISLILRKKRWQHI